MSPAHLKKECFIKYAVYVLFRSDKGHSPGEDVNAKHGAIFNSVNNFRLAFLYTYFLLFHYTKV